MRECGREIQREPRGSERETERARRERERGGEREREREKRSNRGQVRDESKPPISAPSKL